MTPETLSNILQDAPGVTRATAAKGDKTDPGWTVEAEHRATLYLAFEGASTQVGDIVKIVPRSGYVRVETRDRTVHMFPVELVQSISVKPPREAGSHGRAGF